MWSMGKPWETPLTHFRLYITRFWRYFYLSLCLYVYQLNCVKSFCNECCMNENFRIQKKKTPCVVYSIWCLDVLETNRTQIFEQKECINLITHSRFYYYGCIYAETLTELQGEIKGIVGFIVCYKIKWLCLAQFRSQFISIINRW